MSAIQNKKNMNCLFKKLILACNSEAKENSVTLKWYAVFSN